MTIKAISIIFITIIFFGCSQKNIFPTDNKEYDSPKNYAYQYSQHKFNSKNTTSISGLYIKTNKKSKGLIVLANGIYQNMSFRFGKWLWIVESGYDLFTFDYRGYGDSIGDADIFGFRDDTAAALEYAHALDKNKKIIFIGQSLGGSLVIKVLGSKEYDYVSLAVVDSAFTSFATSTSRMMMKSIILFPISWLPYTFFPHELDSINNIEYVKVPILFISGDSDFIIDYENSKLLYEKANTKKHLWIVEGAGHVRSFENEDVKKAFLELLMDIEQLDAKPKRNFNY